MRRFRLFLRGLATNWTGTAGVVLTTSAFVLFLFMELLRVLELVTNAYVGLVSYMVLPALFLLGLLLIPLGWRRYRRATGRTTAELLDERFTPELAAPRALGSNLVLTIAGLTLLNLVFLGAGGARMLHFMDEPVFCGTACHRVMHPEWITYQDSPHARVKCVECHVGEGAEALLDAKLNGLWQIVSATFHLYDQPIPTPVHQLRPARETCERCHWPDRFYGRRIVTFTRHAFDEASTPRYTTLALKVGSGAGDRRGEIHWHVAAANEVRYASRDDAREEMLWVEVRKPDGFWRYRNRRWAQAAPDSAAEAASVDGGAERILDCVDCHNRATHIYQDPEDAVDALLAGGRLDRRLPFLKREALKALTAGYPDTAAAMAGIAAVLHGGYTRRHGGAALGLQPEIDAAVAALRAVYRRNIHPLMRVGWDSYPDHRGHRRDGGCFRCHNPDLVDAYGTPIPHDCTLCHSFLAYESATPYRFLQPAAEGDPERRLHEHLQAEFLTGAP